jgi:hypothetical protein
MVARYKTEHMRIRQDDTDTAAITAHFDRSFAFIDSCRGACLVHCGAGISRSATLVIAYMMRKSKWPLDTALKHVQARRAAVRPNNGFMQALRDFENSPESGVLAACASAVLSVYKGDTFVEDIKLKGGKCLAGRAPVTPLTTRAGRSTQQPFKRNSTRHTAYSAYMSQNTAQSTQYTACSVQCGQHTTHTAYSGARDGSLQHFHSPESILDCTHRLPPILISHIRNSSGTL